jgi:hypothetical protein
VVVLAVATSASAEPEPKVIDSKPFRDKLVVLRDEHGGIYAVDRESEKAWYGTGKSLYEQVVQGSSSDGSDGSWELDIWVPRVSGFRPGTIRHNADGSFMRYCSPDATPGTELKLTLVPADQAKHLLERSQLMTMALVRQAHLLARDETGVYYYVDEFRRQYGEGGYRVFVGKKGAMRQLPLTDIATDTAGEIFATKSGDIRLVFNRDDQSGDSKPMIAWVQGEKRTALVMLDLQANLPVIYRGLGVYPFVGTICDDL